jgi:UDP-N-acetylmuramoyl-L-alanyl-D-glutamate--2,6-diaminopimelate ligase
MELGQVLAAGEPGVEITGLAYDSRRVTPGALFFAVPGFQHDGHEFAPEAVSRGAAALVVERPLGLGVPEVVVHSVRKAMGPAAARFYGHPSADLALVAVTGTNGKTTTTFMVRAMIEEAGQPCGLIGTVKVVTGGLERPGGRTTPEAIDLQAELRAMADAGDRACSLEASSHGLALDRCEGMHPRVAIFTNLTRDHFDFHESMEDYFQAKRRLFTTGPDIAVVNVEDEYGRRLAAEFPNAITYALDAPADYRGEVIDTGLAGSRFRVSTPGGPVELRCPMPGRHNAANATAAFAAARAVGVEDAVAAGALAALEAVPGRLQPIRAGQDFEVLIDYSHTPDSLRGALETARALAGSGRLVCVLGCGGDRDPGKRPRMGAIAAELADHVIVTSDNPRWENPEAIIREVLDGAGDVESYVDRREAIERALHVAATGDLVLIAGKGHEHYQEIAGYRLPFDDAAIAREALVGLISARPPGLSAAPAGSTPPATP